MHTKRLTRRRGATAVGYALLVALIAIAAIGAVSQTGVAVSDLFQAVSNRIGGGANVSPAQPGEPPAEPAGAHLAMASAALPVLADGSGWGECTALPVANTGDLAAEGLSFAQFGGPNAANFSVCEEVANPCGPRLDPGSECNFGVRVSSEANGSLTAVAEVVAAGLTASRALNGIVSGLPADLDVYFADGGPVVYTSSPSYCTPIIVENRGIADAEVRGFAVTENPSQFSVCASNYQPCPALPFALAPGARCATGVQHSATQNGRYEGRLQVSFRSAASPQDEVVGMTLTGEARSLPGECPLDWETYNGTCYRLSVVDRIWQYASNGCVSDNGNLVTIGNAAENDFLAATFPTPAWIGYRRTSAGGAFTWFTTGSSGGFTAWRAGEPNGTSAQSCAVIQSDGTWTDEACSSVLYGICKKPMVLAP